MATFPACDCSCGIGDACFQRGGPPLAVAGRSQGRGERTRERQGAEGNEELPLGHKPVSLWPSNNA